MTEQHPIGVFDSGYGGLTVLREITSRLPEYDYCYLGDNARAPYGTRSFEVVYQYTLQAVKWLFDQGCPLVILACNTASAKALRTIQQQDLVKIAPENRVLGVIRPTAEVIGTYSESGEIGVLGTNGTVQSESYLLEIQKTFPDLKVYQQACPIWVPLIENGLQDSKGADYFVRDCLHSLFKQGKDIDTLLLACTHYPLLLDKIREYSPIDTKIISQGPIVAESLADYLQRHPEMEQRLSQGKQRRFYTTDDAKAFASAASQFYGEAVSAEQVHW